MFIAHMPAGFLLARYVLRKEQDHPAYISLFLIGLIASIAPDFDLAYFYLIDNRQHPHHSYWTHIPVYWMGIYFVLLYPIYKYFNCLGVKVLSLVLFCGLLHMSLDSFASGIRWLYPLTTEYFGLWRITSVYNWWVANYLFHWTFLIELIITSTAAIVAWQDKALQLRFKYQCLIWLYRIRPSSKLMDKMIQTAEIIQPQQAN